MQSFESSLVHALKILQKHKLLRKTLPFPPQKSPENSEENFLCFASNDYLSLKSHPELCEVAVETILKYGVGAGSAPLLSGYTAYHESFEKTVARFKRKEKALLFGSGYLANLGILATVPGTHDLILSDALNHASIQDAMRLSRAQKQIYPHRNVPWLENYLRKHRQNYHYVFLVTDAIFSMDGDIAPLDALYALAEHYELIPIIDEAHATGVLGTNGRGIEDYYNCTHPQAILMGTLGKALGSYGAFVTGKGYILDYLQNKARSLIYSTALPPVLLTPAQRALELLQSPQSPLTRLRKNIKLVHQEFTKLNIPSNAETPIFPIITGTVSRTLEIAEIFRRQKIFLPAIRPPSVAHKSSRLRISIQANHTESEIQKLIKVTREALK